MKIKIDFTELDALYHIGEDLQNVYANVYDTEDEAWEACKKLGKHCHVYEQLVYPNGERSELECVATFNPEKDYSIHDDRHQPIDEPYIDGVEDFILYKKKGEKK
jgi:hypothetical protein